MSVELVKKEEAPVPAIGGAIWGAAEDFAAEDLVIPRLLLQQQMSPLVGEDKAKAGDWFETLEWTRLATSKEKLEVIMFMVAKSYGIFLSKDGQNRHVRTEPVNDTIPFVYEEETPEGKIQRSLQRDFYCLPVKNLHDSIPMVLRLRRASSNIGKRLMTAFAKAAKQGLSSADYVIQLTYTKEIGEKGTYLIPDFEVGRRTTPEEVAAVKGWYETLNAGNHAVQEEAEEAAADTVGVF